MPQRTSVYKKARWIIVLINIASVAFAIPLTCFSILLPVLGDDSGTNPVGLAMLVLACAIIPAVIVCIVLSQTNFALSQKKRSYGWAIVGLAVPFVPLLALLLYSVISTVTAMGIKH